MKQKAFKVTKDIFYSMMLDPILGGIIIKEELNYPVPDGYHIALFDVDILEDNGNSVTVLVTFLRIKKDRPLPPSSLV